MKLWAMMIDVAIAAALVFGLVPYLDELWIEVHSALAFVGK